MREIDNVLRGLRESLCKTVDIGGLLARNRVAHKWKVTFHSLTLRETIYWRTQDLLAQSLLLHDAGHTLGARILLRSALESVAILIYVNQLTRRVISRIISFAEFRKKISVLLLGSRDLSTPLKAISILTVLEKCDARYAGLQGMYEGLSESAHPNYEGTCIGYSQVDREEFVTTFQNRWHSLYSAGQIEMMMALLTIFVHEYDDEWKDAFTALENWLTDNDAELEATKD